MNNSMKHAGTLVLLAGLALGSFARPAAADFDSWYEKVKISGDFRYRFENILKDKTADRDRQRIRVRLNLEAPLDDYWKAAVQVATGGLTDAVSTNQTLGDDLNRKTVDLSLAYLEYKFLFDNGKVQAGKIPNPFVCAGKNQMIWDGDLTFDGIGGNANVDIVQDLNAFVNGGGFWLREQSSNDDPMVYGAQAGLKGKLANLKYTLGYSYYLYKDAKGQPFFLGTQAGNTALGKNYRYNYKIAEGFLELSYPILGLPITAYGNAVKNFDNEVADRNTGFTAGLIVNKVKGEGTWEAGAYTRKLDRDAVAGAYSDSDFGGGGTDSMGQCYYAAYGITDSVTAKVTHFNNQQKADLPTRVGYHRTQVDLELKY